MPPRTCFLVPVLVLILVLPGAGASRVRKKALRSRSCLDLPEEILEQMFGRLSVGVMSAFHHALQLEPREGLNRSCPAGTGTGTGTGTGARLPANLRSISPWSYKISYDPARYPRYIPEAQCLCKGCLLGPQGQENPRFRSVPVYAPSVVLRRTGSCLGGRHSYAEIYVSVAVGCTCVPLLEMEKERGGDQSLQRPGKPGQARRRT